MTEVLRNSHTIGCCGIDCGLCPRFYTKGASACPGCGGLGFRELHPSCGFVTCCALHKGLNVCADCSEYPCRRFDSEKNGYDSFVSHRRVLANNDFIRSNGMDVFIAQQRLRMNLLRDFLVNYDDGRSKSFYCLSCSLLPLDTLLEISLFVRKQSLGLPLKEKNKLLRDSLQSAAEKVGVMLKLNKKPNKK